MSSSAALRESLAAVLEWAETVLNEAREDAGAAPSSTRSQCYGTSCCAFTCGGTAKAPSPEVVHGYMSIALDAVRNSCRHACADDISVQLIYRAEGVELTVAENGQGIEETYSTLGAPGTGALQACASAQPQWVARSEFAQP